MTSPPDHSADTHTQELTARISWIIRLRWIAAAGVGATVSLVTRVFGVGLPSTSIYLVTLGLAVYNGGLWALHRYLPRATRGFGLSLFANAQITIDLIFLTALLHLSGGVENPFVCYYVFHIVIASILLSRHATYLQVVFAVALVIAMAVAEATGLVPHHHLAGYLGEELYRNPTYLVGLTVVVATMLLFTAFMATSIVARLRERERDIVELSSSLSERADELQQAYDTLRHLESDKSAYMRSAAHNLRAPIAAVELALAVVAEGRAGEISDTGREMLQRARKRIGGVLDLASDLLALSRARESVVTADATRVDVCHLVRNCMEELRQAAESARISFEARGEAGPVEVMGDPASLTELLENLVSNALKYTPDGGEVCIRVAEEADDVTITVSDTGMGIEAEDIDHIFEEFYRAQRAQESGKDGTGLGLSIVKAIVESHGGKISVESRPEEGTTCRVMLPRAPAGAAVRQVGR